MIMNIKKVCVIGAGTMGSGIAQICATYGYSVNLVDVNDEILQKAKNSMKMTLEKYYVAKSKMTEEKTESILDKINLFVNQDEAAKDVDIIIEAIFEDMALKQKLFSNLESVSDPSVIFASNTSSLSITDIGSKCNHQERVVGIHFFNPATVMKLVELIKGKYTSDEVLEVSRKFSESVGKTVVAVNDAPGFVTTRLIYVLCNEAANMKMAGIANTRDIDIACKLAFNFPMGPLELSDLVGNDIYLHIGEYLESEFGEKYTPSPLLKEMVEKNLLGRKTKEGFYKY